MRFIYTRGYQPSVRNPYAHVSKGVVDIIEDVDDSATHTIGRAEIELVDYTRIFREGMVSLFDVIDARGECWPYLYALLFDFSTGEVLREITQPGTFDFIVLMNRIELLPIAKSVEATILYHLAHLNGSASLFNMYSYQTTLCEEKLAEIGFARIANSDLLFLHTSSLSWNPGYSEGGLKLKLDPRTDYTLAMEKLWYKV